MMFVVHDGFILLIKIDQCYCNDLHLHRYRPLNVNVVYPYRFRAVEHRHQNLEWKLTYTTYSIVQLYMPRLHLVLDAFIRKLGQYRLSID